MGLTLDALNVLDAIDRKGSFAAAADELYRVPSAVSYTMQKLEQDLGITIFDRSGHRAVLTAAGRALLEEGRQLLQNAQHLESHVQRIATGWEAELRIAVDTILPIHGLFSLTQEFYRENCGTRLAIREEVLAGTWDALLTERADLAIGVSGDAPSGSDYSSHPLGEMEMVFAVAPHHPLATASEPLQHSDILKHRAVAIADTSRNLPVRSAGLLLGQEVLTVPDMHSKLEAQCLGLGVGSLPRPWAQAAIDAGRLQVKAVQGPASRAQLGFSWRSKHQGKALQWFISHLKKISSLESFFPPTPQATD